MFANKYIPYNNTTERTSIYIILNFVPIFSRSLTLVPFKVIP